MKLAIAFASLCATAQAQFNDGRFDSVVQKLEDTAFALRDEIEELYLQNHCNPTAFASCQVYDECNSAFPNPVCTDREDFQIEAICGSCPVSVDFTTSSIGMAPGTRVNGIHPRDPDVIRSLCFPSTALDNWFQQRVAQDASFWEPLGLAPNGLYFGSTEGTFRMFPGRHAQYCAAFDPRIRPWYVAGGSGAKNVVMILDQSGSMMEPRISLLKEAAKRVVDTLTIGDRVAIVPFNDKATKIADNGILYIASNENKRQLHQVIDSLRPSGATDFYAAFTAAFEILEDSIEVEAQIKCNTALLFLTDGVLMPDDPSVTTKLVMETVLSKINTTSALLKHPIHFFTYSVSTDDDVHEFPSSLACSVPDGIWSRVRRPQDIVDALSSYYLLFASGLGTNLNRDFAAWVEPYVFFTDDELGTTVSVPVYDRSQSPSLFLGVVGVDVALATLNNALGTNDNTEAIKRLALLSSGNCPVVELEDCELEFYRVLTGGAESMCSDSCPLETFDQQLCSMDAYPEAIVANDDQLGKSASERICCDGCSKSEDSSKSSSNLGIIIGAVGGGVVLLVLVSFFVFNKKKDTAPSTSAAIPVERVVPLAPPPATAPYRHAQ